MHTYPQQSGDKLSESQLAELLESLARRYRRTGLRQEVRDSFPVQRRKLLQFDWINSSLPQLDF